MDIWAQSYIALHPLAGQVDNGFVKFILAKVLSVVRQASYEHDHVQVSSQYCGDNSKQTSFDGCEAVCLGYAQRQGRGPVELSPVPRG